MCVIPGPRNRTPIAGEVLGIARYIILASCVRIYTYLYAHTLLLLLLLLVYCIRGLFVMVTKRRLYTASVGNGKSHNVTTPVVDRPERFRFTAANTDGRPRSLQGIFTFLVFYHRYYLNPHPITR